MLIDVSYHNGIIDWEKVKASGVQGAILRCGYGDNIASQDDKQYKRNADECTRLGIPWGVYIYSYAKNTTQAKSEAEHVLRLVAPYKDKMSYPVFYDLEEKGTESVAVQNALVFGDIIENNGYMCGIYSGQSWWQKHLGNKLDRFPKWVARYNTQKPVGISGTYDIWQYSSDGSVPGINGRVDVNEVYRDFPAEIRGGSTKKDADGTVNDSTGTMQDMTDTQGKISYQVHARKVGWLPWKCDGQMAGSTGQSRRLEALKIKFAEKLDVLVHMRGIGDKLFENVDENTVIGTVGEGRRIEALKLICASKLAYRVHQKSYGWSKWGFSGDLVGVPGEYKQIEAIEIKKPKLVVRGHVQNVGWQDWVPDGCVVGTTGKSYRMEALQIDPCGNTIKAKAHMQTDGWVDYGVVTADTIIGTTGESKRIECLCFEGDFEYRAHIQDYGWTPWTKADGVSTLGTVGQALRIEAFETR